MGGAKLVDDFVLENPNLRRMEESKYGKGERPQRFKSFGQRDRRDRERSGSQENRKFEKNEFSRKYSQVRTTQKVNRDEDDLYEKVTPNNRVDSKPAANEQNYRPKSIPRKRQYDEGAKNSKRDYRDRKEEEPYREGQKRSSVRGDGNYDNRTGYRPKNNFRDSYLDQESEYVVKGQGQGNPPARANRDYEEDRYVSKRENNFDRGNKPQTQENKASRNDYHAPKDSGVKKSEGVDSSDRRYGRDKGEFRGRREVGGFKDKESYAGKKEFEGFKYSKQGKNQKGFSDTDFPKL